MPRVRKGATRARKHKKVLKAARGYIGAASRRYRVAIEARLRAGQYATIGRKLRKRDFRRLWITRISAACRQRGMTYSRFMHGLSENGVAVNRKMLADLAVADPNAFDRLAAVATGQAPPEAAPAAAPADKVEKAPQPKKPAAVRRKPKPAEAQAEAPAEQVQAKPAKKKAVAAKKKTAAKKTTTPKPTRKKTTAARKKTSPKKGDSEGSAKQ